MSAYVILDLRVTDPTIFEQYKQLGPPIVLSHGGRYLVRGGRVTTHEGDWTPERLVIFEFPDRAAAESWLDGTDYAPARAIRRQAASGSVIIVDGI